MMALMNTLAQSWIQPAMRPGGMHVANVPPSQFGGHSLRGQQRPLPPLPDRPPPIIPKLNRAGEKRQDMRVHSLREGVE